MPEFYYGSCEVHGGTWGELLQCPEIHTENGHLVESLGGVGPEIPGHLGALDTSLRVSLLGVDEIRELDWVLNEENWSVVSNDVVVSFFGVKFDSETSWIPIAIVCSTLSSDG